MEDLSRLGIDVGAALARGDLVMLDARETLDRLMVGDRPDRLRFKAVIGAALASAGRDGRRVRAFGEMVELLWQAGRFEAAVQLERMWSDLARSHRFELLCAYTITSFYKKTAPENLRDICALHDHVATPEPTARDGARILLEELARRANVERELRETVHALQRSLELERTRAGCYAKLQQATAALASAVSLGELTDTILETSEQLVGATAAVIYLADPDGVFRLSGAHDVPHVATRWPTLPLEAPLPLARTLATGEALWIEHREQLRALFPRVTDEQLAASRMYACATLPFMDRERVVGGIALGFETQRAFSDEERTWLASFAAQCTLAIERVRQHTAEHKARTEAENLLRITASLSGMQLDLEAILQRVTDEATALVGAQFGAFFYNVENERGEPYLLYALSGARKEQFAKLGVPRITPLFADTFEGRGVVRIDDVTRDPRYGRLAPHHGMPPGHPPVTSYLAVPVRSRSGKVTGGLLFGHGEPGKFTAQHESAIRALAITASIAIDNAELYRAAREAEDAQRKTVTQLVETVHMNELFTGVLAHDLRNPLAAVTTASELLLHESTTTERHVVERVLVSAHRMARMIEQLLDFTRIRIGSGLPIDSRPCDLHALVAHVVDELRAAHAKQPIRVEAKGDLHGRWDDDRLAQAFSNLIGNAAQHGLPERGVDVHIDGSEPAVVRVHIRNAGAIPGDVLARIFEPMTGGQRRRDGTRGLGLGLFITREIATAHGGTVVVESSADAGTTFTLSLPREVESVERAREIQAPAQVGPHGRDLDQRMRALVEGVRDCAIFMLDRHGHVQTWTDTAEQLTGWTRDAIVGRSIAAVCPPDDRNLLDVELGRAAKLGLSEREGAYVRCDGSPLWGQLSLSAIRGASGGLAGFGAVLRDLTQQRAAHRELAESHARLRLMVESVRDYAIFMLDASGNVVSWNHGAQLAKGYTQGEIVGRHLSTFYTREDREAGRPQWLLERATREGRVEDEGWRIRKDGSRFWADVVITALRDDRGELRGFAKVTRDLTERRRAEEELRRSEERFRLLIESVKDYAIFVLDPTGHVMTWNAGAERNNGYRAHEILGAHFSKFYEPEEVRAGACERELELAIRDGRFEDEGWRIRKDGSRFWANVVIAPLRGPKGELVGFAKVTRDLTERRNLEEERVRVIQAQEGIRLRDEFLSIVSHELKTPLAGLLLQIDAITRRTADAALVDKLARVRESGERLDRLIEMLLDVSRIATGRFVLAPQPGDLAALLRDAIESFQLAAAKAGCELVLDLPDRLDGVWDRVRLSQVFANLLANAIKYGTGRPIHVRLARRPTGVELSVRDHGPGIDPAMLSRIFDRFERAVSTRHYGGLGLGLYVVREIVAAHGGTVAAENSPGGGARFVVRLPVEAPA